jgi:16S rRNA (cytosine1402-N4)-methyltransferase
LVSWWRLSIITFHSSEDRLVKHLLAPYLDSKDDEITGQVIVPALCKKIYKKPLLPGQSELENNPRARSAKLRCIEKN